MRDLALQPVGVDVRGFNQCGAVGARSPVLLTVVDVHTLDPAALCRVLATACAIVVLVVHVTRLQHLVHFIVPILLLLLLELHRHANVVIKGVAGNGVTLPRRAAAAVRKVRDELAHRHKLRELLACGGSHEAFYLGLALRIGGVVVLENLQHLLGGAPQYICRLVAKLALDHPQERLVRGACLTRLRAVGPICLGGEHAPAGAHAPSAFLLLRGVRV
mmetsp:Transcript_24203/g.60074  ORF Transcript_24203/g.60074 Transcript_24203/m.60074 type:complete len:218 (+) Transcript_24203:4312-4965(+)